VKKTTWLGILFVVLVLGYLVVSSFQRQAYRCQICITFKGRRDCGTAAAQSEQDARRAATTIARPDCGRNNRCESMRKYPARFAAMAFPALTTTAFLRPGSSELSLASGDRSALR
jgi:hypothetical protein